MFFDRHPRAYYGKFSIFFRGKLCVLIFSYIAAVLSITVVFSFFYDLAYAGPSEGLPVKIKWLHNFYFSLVTLISPGFTEFVPCNDHSRLLASVNGIVGIILNGLFISFLIARILLPSAPFVIVPFLLYDPAKNTLTARFYSTLPANCYNVHIKFHRFMIFTDHLGREMGTTREIDISKKYRNVLLPNYGILVEIAVDSELNSFNATSKRKHVRKKIPLEWIVRSDPKFPEGHFYLTIEAETPHGKMFQKQDFYVNKEGIKCGRHPMLNEGIKLTMENWYNWRLYRWDLWGKVLNIEPTFDNDQIWDEYK